MSSDVFLNGQGAPISAATDDFRRNDALLKLGIFDILLTLLSGIFSRDLDECEAVELCWEEIENLDRETLLARWAL